MRRECREASNSQGERSDNITSAQSLSQDKRNELLAAYTKSYQPTWKLEHRPSGATLNFHIKRNDEKSADRIQLSKAPNMAGGRDSYKDPLKLGKHLSVNLGGALKWKTSDSNASPDAYLRAVRVLMMGYVLVAAADSGRPRRSLGAARKHISTMGDLSRMSAKAGQLRHRKILESDMNARREWTRIAQPGDILRTVEVVDSFGRWFAIWPISTELKAVGGKRSLSKQKSASTAPYSNDWNSWQI